MVDPEATVLEVNVEIRRILGRQPQEWLVSKSWAMVEMKSRRELDSGHGVDHVVNDDFDHAELAVAACLDVLEVQGHDVVELTVSFGPIEHLPEATRKHTLDRIINGVLAQRSGVTIYVGWDEDRS